MCKDTRYFDFIIRKCDNVPHRGTPKVLVRIEAERLDNDSYVETRRASAVCHEKDQPSKKMFITIAGGRLDALKQSRSDMTDSTLDHGKRDTAARRFGSLMHKEATFDTPTTLEVPKVPSTLHLQAPLLDFVGHYVDDNGELGHTYTVYLCRAWIAEVCAAE